MDKVIGNVIGTRKAGEDAEIVEATDGKILVRWLKSDEIVKFESRNAFDAWTLFNRFIERIDWAA